LRAPLATEARAGNGCAGFLASGPIGRKTNAARECVIARKSENSEQCGASCDDHMIVMFAI